METLQSLLEFELWSYGKYSLKLGSIVIVLLIILITHLILLFFKKALFRRSRKKNLDYGTTYAYFKIVQYFVWVLAVGIVLETVGIKLTLLLAGSAALLVGIGLGLQQTFNDIISGFILLSERSIKIDDVLEIDGDVVKIQTIGLRTSKALNRDDISIIIPNSLITTSKVINWSHQTEKTRFRIEVGVAYGSDVDKVIDILEESAFEHEMIPFRDLVEARLVGFGSSSLDFHLLFFSDESFRIGKLKSDIRRIIDRKFNENGIVIAFPQLDVHVKKESSSVRE